MLYEIQRKVCKNYETLPISGQFSEREVGMGWTTMEYADTIPDARKKRDCWRQVSKTEPSNNCFAVIRIWNISTGREVEGKTSFDYTCQSFWEVRQEVDGMFCHWIYNQEVTHDQMLERLNELRAKEKYQKLPAWAKREINGRISGELNLIYIFFVEFCYKFPDGEIIPGKELKGDRLHSASTAAPGQVWMKSRKIFTEFRR